MKMSTILFSKHWFENTSLKPLSQALVLGTRGAAPLVYMAEVDFCCVWLQHMAPGIKFFDTVVPRLSWKLKLQKQPLFDSWEYFKGFGQLISDLKKI